MYACIYDFLHIYVHSKMCVCTQFEKGIPICYIRESLHSPTTVTAVVVLIVVLSIVTLVLHRVSTETLSLNLS